MTAANTEIKRNTKFVGCFLVRALLCKAYLLGTLLEVRFSVYYYIEVRSSEGRFGSSEVIEKICLVMWYERKKVERKKLHAQQLRN